MQKGPASVDAPGNDLFREFKRCEPQAVITETSPLPPPPLPPLPANTTASWPTGRVSARARLSRTFIVAPPWASAELRENYELESARRVAGFRRIGQGSR